MRARIAALAAILPLATSAMAQDRSMPRVIYGETMPNVLYGPESAPPPEPRRADPAPRPQPLPQPQGGDGGTVVERGWLPQGPPGWNRPPRAGWGPPPPRIPDQPMPQGSLGGATPDGRSSFGRR